jgi:hypothetical protein
MNIKHRDIVIPSDNPFLNCKLGREKYAKTLTSIVKAYDSGFVLAINNEWGTGKTTFVRMWEQQLKIQGFRTLYFNAWENDFELNPQTAILAELQLLFDEKDKKKFEPLLKKGAIVAKNVIPSLLKGLVKRYLDVETLYEGVEKSAEAATEILKDEIDNYAKRKKGMKDFRTELEQIVTANEGLPLIFIVDELDRCRPNYAVETLEQIKHLFSVQGIVFVLSIAKTQLGNAIKGVYGSEHMDVDEYLRRFIDVEFSIPDPEMKTLVNYLFDYFEFDSFLNSPSRIKFQELKNDLQYFKETAIYLFETKRMSLRQVEKFLAHARIGLDGFEHNHYVYPSAYLILLFVKIYHPSFYFEVSSTSDNLQDMYNKLDEIIGAPHGELESLIWYGEAALIFIYFRGYRDRFPDAKLFTQSSTAVIEYIHLRMDSEDKKNHFKRFFETFKRSGFSSTPLSHLTNRIDLIYEVMSKDTVN